MIIDQGPLREYKNLVFDVGGVLLGYRPREMMIEDHKMAPEEADRFLEEVFSNSLWDEFDLENIPFEEVVGMYIKLFPKWEEHIRWMMSNTHLMPVRRPKVWDEVKRLKDKGYKIYLLSNYSSVLFAKHTKGASFLDSIDGAVVSYQIHRMKPEAVIYQTLFEKYALRPGDCLFFDDRLENIVASSDLGMDSFRVTSEESLLAILHRL